MSTSRSLSEMCSHDCKVCSDSLCESPEREQIIRAPASIDYQTLRSSHLQQVHELLSRTFWPGIDGTFLGNSLLRMRLCLFYCCSERRTALLARTMHSRSHLQTACRRCSVPVLPTRDIHHVPRCQSWMGKLSHCDVRYLLDHVIITLK